ncbi:hypothetical protein GCM10023212_42730 [Luteolibacter yonseiensis]
MNGMTSCLRILVLPFLAIAPLAAAPAWRSELTTSVPGSFPIPAPTRLELRVSWNGMVDAGKVRIEFAPQDVKKAGSYVIRSSASSLGPAEVLFPYKTSFWSELVPDTLRPRFFQSLEDDKTEHVTTTIRYFSDRVECGNVTKQIKDGSSKQKDRVFTSSPVFDLFSAMLHVRSQKLDDGDRSTLVIHPFETPYLLRVKVVGREVHNGRNTIRLTLGMRKIDRKTGELQPYKKLKQDATLWLSDDAERMPVELRAAAFIGDIRVTRVLLEHP